jgi:DNA-binding beta-propeller fold protein YncE
MVTAEDGVTTQTTMLEVTRLPGGPNFSSPRGIALDSATNRVLVVEAIPPALAAVMTVDFSTGDRAILSDSAAGMGPNFRFPRGIALDSATNRALVVDAIPPLLAAVMTVDLSTGDRAILSDNATGTGPNLSSPLGIALDSATNRALVVDASLAAVVAVDLSTGDRAILSDASTGTGPAFSYPLGIALDSANNRALVVDSSLAAVVAVDLSTGDRTILSDASTGTGPHFPSPVGIALDSATNRILVVDSSLAAVIAVDPSSGDRTVYTQ